MTREEMITLLKFLANSYPNQLDFPTGDKESDNAMISTWMEWLGSYDIEDVKAAVKLATQKNPDWVPSPARISSEIGELNSDTIPAEEAWEKALGAARGFHPRANPHPEEDLPNPIKKAIEAIGGIQTIADKKPEDTYVVDSFYKRYKNIKERQKKKELLPSGQEENQERIESIVGKLAEDVDFNG